VAVTLSAGSKTNLILRSERSERLEGWAKDTAFAAHPSRRLLRSLLRMRAFFP